MSNLDFSDSFVDGFLAVLSLEISSESELDFETNDYRNLVT